MTFKFTFVFGGVCDRYPDLKIMLVHGGGHFPYQIGRLTHGWSVRPETKALQTPPLDYLKWFYYDTVLYDDVALDYLATKVGRDRLVAGSDYPFTIKQDRPAEFAEQVLGLPRETFTGNAMGLLGLKAKARS